MMMTGLKKIIQTTFTRVVPLVWLAAFTQCGAGMSTEPVPILAPVAGLISISSPDANGVSKVVGVTNSANANAPIVITNQSSGVTVNATATSSGGFTAQLPSGVGNTVVFQQETGEGLSENSEPKLVPANAPAISGSPIATAVDTDVHLGFVASVSGENSVLSVVNLDNFFDADDFFLELSVPFTGIMVTDMAYDLPLAEFYMVDNTNDKIEVRELDGDVKGAAITLPNPISVAADPNFNVAVVGLEDENQSVSIIDNSGGAPILLLSHLITHPTVPAAEHVRTFAVSADLHTGSGFLRLAALSTFSNEDTVFSLLDATTGAALAQVNLGSGTFGRLELFDDTLQAVIADTANDRVIHLSTAVTPMDTRANITVGDAPVGITADEISNTAFVTNSLDNTVSIVDLDGDTEMGAFDSGDSVGLGPVDISMDINASDGVFAAIVANGDGQTATLIDIFAALTGEGF